MSKQLFKTQRILVFMLAALLVAGIVLPMMAQDTTVETSDASTVIVTGAISFSANGDIVVGDYIIAPAGAFTPSSLNEGDVVIIIGRLLPDGVTVQADSLELFEEPEVEVTPEATVEATPEATVEATPEATVEATPEATVEATPEVTAEPEVCGNPNYPVATRIAAEFSVSYDEVMAMHCAGNGFGNIVRAFLLAEASGGTATAQSFLDRHHGGEGWGQIMRESGQHPSSFAPGRAIGKDKDAEATPEAEVEASTTQRGNGNNGNGGGNGGGNGNGNGGGNGNNGNNGNGGSNGNGNNGNGGGNGGGNGNGKGKGGN